MRRIVLKFGLLSGALLSAMLAVTIPVQDAIGFDYGMVVGYTTMVLAFLLIYFGVRRYRDTVAGGSISFGRACKVGALIALISSCGYVATWEVMYFKFMPDFTLPRTAAGGVDYDLAVRRSPESGTNGEHARITRTSPSGATGASFHAHG